MSLIERLTYPLVYFVSEGFACYMRWVHFCVLSHSAYNGYVLSSWLSNTLQDPH